MAFFPQNLYNANEASFTPLFRLLEDFDTYSRQSGSSHGTDSRGSATPQRRQPTWQPRFDLRETNDVYELYGELPGLNKEHVAIEFPDFQTMTISGTTERSYSAGSTSANKTPAEASSTQRRGSYQSATVEDDVDGDKFEVVNTPTTDNTKSEQAPSNETAAHTSKPKYWLSERGIGEFSRTFNFASRVEHDAVSAGLDNGILHIIVPKAKKHEPRRVFIN